MTKIAVDVALLLPKKINKICVDINQKSGSDHYSDLSKKDNYPHITLAMGVVDEENLEKVNDKLKEIAEKFSEINLKILGVHPKTNIENKKSCAFEIEITKELKKLHATVMNEVSPLFSYNVENEMFYLDSDEMFATISKFWVGGYKEAHSDPENFHPHISLKCRNFEYDEPSINFIASDLVLCHLGNHCTCREILGEFRLYD